jgi:MFS family permease
VHRFAITVVGISAALGSFVAAVILGYLASFDNGADSNAWLVLALVVAAVAAPIYGTVAGIHGSRWVPLLVGLAAGGSALLWLCALADVPLKLPEHLTITDK